MQPSEPFTPLSRRRLVTWLGAGLLGMPFTAQAQTPGYPVRAVRIINPYPPGSPVDVVGRHAADVLQRTLGQPFTVESITGAGGTIGVAAAARAAGDGYSLLSQQSAALINGPLLYKTVAYDVLRDFRPIWALQSPGLVLVVNPKSRFRSLQDVVAAARAEPGKLTFASAGAGTPQHLGAAQFLREAGIDLLHVPYRGAVPAQVALMGGEVDILFDSISGGLTNVQGGNMRALAVTRARRFEGLPDTPTVHEAGLPGLELPVSVIGLYAPSAVPAAVTEAIAKELNQAYQADAKAQERLGKLGLSSPLSGARLQQHLATENAFYARLIKDAKITIDN